MTKNSLKIHDLYPNLSADSQREAEEFFDEYLSLVLEIYHRIELSRNLTEDSKISRLK